MVTRGEQYRDRAFSPAQRERPVLFCFCGPTASGKSSLCRSLLAKGRDLRLSVSTTTRPPRPGEREGVDYHFVSREEFHRRVEAAQFVEHAEFGGNLYGTEHQNILACRDNQADLLFDIEVHGVQQLKRLFPQQVVTIFVVPESFTALEERLRRRGAEIEEQMALRLQRALEEIRILEVPGFADYRIINNAFDVALEDSLAIIRAERLRPLGRIDH